MSFAHPPRLTHEQRETEHHRRDADRSTEFVSTVNSAGTLSWRNSRQVLIQLLVHLLSMLRRDSIDLEQSRAFTIGDVIRVETRVGLSFAQVGGWAVRIDYHGDGCVATATGRVDKDQSPARALLV